MGETPAVVGMDPADHAMVAAAMVRLGSRGAWDRMLAGAAVTDALDRADAELLVGGRDPQHGRRRATRWHATSRCTRDGVRRSRHAVSAYPASRSAARRGPGSGLGRPGRRPRPAPGPSQRADRRGAGCAGSRRCPRSRPPSRAGTARFLDVGVGVGAISIGPLPSAFRAVTCVGLDVVPEVLVLAPRGGRGSRVGATASSCALLSVADLSDDAAYDLGWLPQPFIPRPVFEAGVDSIIRAVRPDGWIVVPLMTPPDLDSAFEPAAVVHGAPCWAAVRSRSQKRPTCWTERVSPTSSVRTSVSRSSCGAPTVRLNERHRSRTSATSYSATDADSIAAPCSSLEPLPRKASTAT